ncbi:MAG: hypothetical protein PWP65_815 [Clostridia bacterium]|nr:hypothetical protein [Clostridia bacterium]
MLTLIGGYFIIFFARVADVSLATLRMLLLVRAKRFSAGAIGFFEVIIYIIALKFVFDRLTDPLSLVFYALGFATGNIAGSYIEEKLAIGYLTAQVIPCGDPEGLINVLREAGFGVTVWQGLGREGPHPVLNISFHRKDLKKLQALVDDWDAKAFMVVLETRFTHGGIFLRRKGK